MKEPKSEKKEKKKYNKPKITKVELIPDQATLVTCQQLPICDLPI